MSLHGVDPTDYLAFERRLDYSVLRADAVLATEAAPRQPAAPGTAHYEVIAPRRWRVWELAPFLTP